MPYLDCRVLVFLGWDLLGLGYISVCASTVALTPMLPPACGWFMRRGGKGGVLTLVGEPCGNEYLKTY